MKGYCEQYTIVRFYQRQETGELDVCLNSPTSCLLCHVFYSMFILMWQINRYGSTQCEDNFPLIELARTDALVTTTLHVFCNPISKQMQVNRKFWWWIHAWLASWVYNLCSYTRLCVYKGPMLCCCHVEILDLDKGLHIFILHWALLVLEYHKLNEKQEFSNSCMLLTRAVFVSDINT